MFSNNSDLPSFRRVLAWSNLVKTVNCFRKVLVKISANQSWFALHKSEEFFTQNSIAQMATNQKVRCYTIQVKHKSSTKFGHYNLDSEIYIPTSIEEKIRENNKQSLGTFSSSKSVSTDNKIKYQHHNHSFISFFLYCTMMSSETSKWGKYCK